MIEIHTISSNAFSLNGEILKRQFTVYTNKLDRVILKNLKHGDSLDLGHLSEIYINGGASSLEDILNIVYNFSCKCEGELTPPEEFKIFNATFDKTFE